MLVVIFKSITYKIDDLASNSGAYVDNKNSQEFLLSLINIGKCYAWKGSLPKGGFL